MFYTADNCIDCHLILTMSMNFIISFLTHSSLLVIYYCVIDVLLIIINVISIHVAVYNLDGSQTYAYS